MSTTHADLPASKHFKLEALAEGVYAAIAAEGGGAVCNAGILDLGEQTLVFDTFQTPQAARDLRAAAEQLTGRSVTYVVNSHWHGDHVNGNASFAAETIMIATSKTRELMETRSVEELVNDRKTLAGYLESLEQQIAQEQHEARRASLIAWLETNRDYAAVLPTLEIRLPTLTFEERMVFHGSRRTVELLSYGGGHTQSDALLYLPAERVAFLGDLLFVQCHPWLPGGDMEQWQRILQQVERLNIARAVPGHGPVGTLEDAALLGQYIADLTHLGQEAAREGKSKDEFKRTAIPERYAGWRYRAFFRKNLSFLYQHLIEAAEYMRA
jgi:glyoxylase-like metal-dependent hydrolase (beta-lactamase superfamily II)